MCNLYEPGAAQPSRVDAHRAAAPRAALGANLQRAVWFSVVSGSARDRLWAKR